MTGWMGKTEEGLYKGQRVAKATNADAVLAEIDFERRQVERKLYQQPPLTSNER